ncbi:hypothetical protein EMCRGX_G010363 [Ephydatia muelleri]
MISLLKIKELRCADIVQIDSDTDAKDAQFPVTINFKGSSRRTLYLRAQSKADHTSWLEAFKHIVPWTLSASCLASRLPPLELQDRPPIPPPVPLLDSPPTHNSMNSAAISGIKVNGNHDDYTTISNPAVDKPVDVTPIPQATSSFNTTYAQNAANEKLAEQIHKVFTPEQVLGLTDMLSLLCEQSCKDQHLYVNLGSTKKLSPTL